MIPGKCVLVTGAASGIGRATAVRFAEAGAKMVACLDLHEGGAAETVRLIEEAGSRAVAIKVDLGDVDQIRSAYAQAEAALGRLDIAAHIGGYSWRGATPDVTADQWDTVIDVNLRGTFFCCQEALRIMYAQGSGAIVNTSADAAFYPVHGFAVQAAGKGGVAFITETLGLESARRGVRVNAVSPGCTTVVKTGAPWHAWPPISVEDCSPAPAKTLEEAADHQIAAGRFLDPREVAEVVLFLSSDAASGVSGQTIKVNGGGYLTMQMPVSPVVKTTV